MESRSDDLRLLQEAREAHERQRKGGEPCCASPPAHQGHERGRPLIRKVASAIFVLAVFCYGSISLFSPQTQLSAQHHWENEIRKLESERRSVNSTFAKKLSVARNELSSATERAISVPLQSEPASKTNPADLGHIPPPEGVPKSWLDERHDRLDAAIRWNINWRTRLELRRKGVDLTNGSAVAEFNSEVEDYLKAVARSEREQRRIADAHRGVVQ